MATAAQPRQPQKGLTFEDVWIMFQETDKRFQETDRLVKESKAEHDRMIAETDRRFQETDRLVKETDKLVKETTRAVDKMSKRVDRVARNVGGINRSIGELIENLIAARLWEKFSAYPYGLKRAYQRVPVYDEQNKARTDIDILLCDTEWCMAVEVKRHADNSDVDHHLKRMELIRKYPPPAAEGKKLLGAIAGGTMPPGTAEYAHKAGFFVLELAGESVVLLDPPTGFTVREW